MFTGAIDGLVNGDTLESVVSGTLAFTSAATATSNVRLYAIDGSGLTVISPNYQLTILQDAGNATAFEITPATLTYLADAASRVYGDANPTFTGQLLGLKNGETIEHEVVELPTAGVAMGMYNLDDSIREFRACVIQLWPRAPMAGVPFHQEHDPQSL